MQFYQIPYFVELFSFRQTFFLFLYLESLRNILHNGFLIDRFVASNRRQNKFLVFHGSIGINELTDAGGRRFCCGVLGH